MTYPLRVLHKAMTAPEPDLEAALERTARTLARLEAELEAGLHPQCKAAMGKPWEPMAAPEREADR